MDYASIPMRDGDIQVKQSCSVYASAIYASSYCTRPENPLPSLELPENFIAQVPALLKAYMRLGANICGELCRDPKLQTADVFILLQRA